MIKKYFSTITQRPLHSTEDAGVPIVDVAFETEKDATKAFAVILDALNEMEITRHDSTKLTEMTHPRPIIESDDVLREPRWEKESFKLWIVRRY